MLWCDSMSPPPQGATFYSDSEVRLWVVGPSPGRRVVDPSPGRRVAEPHDGPIPVLLIPNSNIRMYQ